MQQIQQRSSIAGYYLITCMAPASSPAAVQVVIEEVSPENYGAGGILIAHRDQPPRAQPREDAHAEPSQ